MGAEGVTSDQHNSVCQESGHSGAIKFFNAKAAFFTQ